MIHLLKLEIMNYPLLSIVMIKNKFYLPCKSNDLFVRIEENYIRNILNILKKKYIFLLMEQKFSDSKH